MRTFHAIQISDMHLSRTHPYFVHNWEVVLEHVNRAKPDLVLSTGDLTLNGAISDDDLGYVREQLDRIGAPVFAVPGNRDVGNNLPNIRNEYSINNASLERYHRLVGQDYWSVDEGDWRLIGIDSILFNSGLASETEQDEWLQSTLADKGARSVAMFFHKPLYLQTPAEKRITQACVMPNPRRQILKMIKSHDIRLISTGHLHEHRVRRLGRTLMLWAPAIAYIVNGIGGPKLGGRRRVGYMEYHFNGRNFRYSLCEPLDMINYDISNWMAAGRDVYTRNIEGPYRGLP
ncbi:MAG: metallophosphoesterase family protein [Acidiferrobacterales bacterium]